MSEDHFEDNILELTVLADVVQDDAAKEPVVSSTPEEAQVWAFQGVHGGAGVTSLVVQMAYELSVGSGKKDEVLPNVLLIDLDFEGGSCSSYLDVPPSLKVEELNAAAGRMDDALAQTFIRKHSQNLSLISANGELGGNDLIDPTVLLTLLDKVSTMYDFILLDVPQMWRSWTQAVIAASDKFSLVMEPSVPALHRAKYLSETITGTMNLPAQPQILLNKFERRTLRNGVTLRDAVQVVGRPDLLTVTFDEDVLRQSINSGQPAGKFKPESRYAKSIRAITHVWRVEKNDCDEQREERRRA